MEEEDAFIIQETVKGNSLKKFYKKDNEKNRALSQAISLFLNDQANKGYMNRINFLISNVHALGASSLAILMALGFILCRKYPIWKLHLCVWDSTDAIWVNLLFFSWLIIAIIFYLGRKGVKSSYRIAKDVFVKIKSPELENFLHINKK